MTTEEIKFINEQRSKEWIETLTKNNATIIIGIGVGHGDSEGEVHLMIPPEIPPENLKAFLLQIVENIKEQNKQNNE